MTCIIDTITEDEFEYPEINLAGKMVSFIKASLSHLSEDYLAYLTLKHRLIILQGLYP